MINRSALIMTYSTCTLINLILEMYNTKRILGFISEIDINNHKVLTFEYQLIYTKILLLLDTYYYASLYLQRRINSIVQLRIVKLITISIHFIIACRLGFTFEIICSFVVQGISFIIISYSSDNEYGSIYTRYNHKISTDIYIINMYIVSEIIKALKNAITIFLLVLIFADITSGRWNNYRILSYFKVTIFVLDRALQKQKLSSWHLNLYSLVMFGTLNLYGLYYVYTLFDDNIVLENEISVFLEIISLFMNVLIIYLLYMYKKRNLSL